MPSHKTFFQPQIPGPGCVCFGHISLKKSVFFRVQLARLTQEGKKKTKQPISNEPRMKAYNRESTRPHMTTKKYLPIHPWDPSNTKEKKSSYLKAFSKSSLSHVLKAAKRRLLCCCWCSVDYSAVPNNPNQTPLTILCNNNLPINPLFLSFICQKVQKDLPFLSSIQKWQKKCQKTHVTNSCDK